MLKVLIVFGIYTLTVCHSATLQEELQTYMEDALLNNIQMGLSELKYGYRQRINELKTEAVSCGLSGSCSGILGRFENLKNRLYQDVEKLKGFEKRTLQLYHRQNHIRCIDCIADYIDDIFSEFCDEMDDELELSGAANIQSSTAYAQPLNVPSATGPTEIAGNQTNFEPNSSNLPANSTKPTR